MLWSPIRRAWCYARAHGVASTLKRAWLRSKQLLRGDRLVLFYCELRELGIGTMEPVGEGKAELKQSQAELAVADAERIANISDPALQYHRMSKRFANGASLWLWRHDSQLAGFGWSITGKTIDTHFFPLSPEDVHLFDFFVFPQYRGQGIKRRLA